MPSYKKTGNTFKGHMTTGQYYLPTCAALGYVKMFNFAKPITHDPCEGAPAPAPPSPPPSVTNNIITFAANTMITFAGDNITHFNPHS